MADLIVRNEEEAGIIRLLSNHHWFGRDELVMLTHRGDREIRQTIQNLRKRGVPIISRSRGGGGYKLANNLLEARPFIDENRSRINELQSVNRAIVSYFGEQILAKKVGDHAQLVVHAQALPF